MCKQSQQEPVLQEQGTAAMPSGRGTGDEVRAMAVSASASADDAQGTGN